MSDDASLAKAQAEVANRQRGLIGLPGVLAILGATLIGVSAMSFVAANWQEMSKLARLLLLGTGMWGAYAAAAVLFARQMPAFGHAAVLAGSAIFGAAIMLVAQMYHIEGNPPDAVLMWAAGAVLAGAAFRSGPALAMVLMCLWSSWETSLARGVHWPFLVGWGAVASCFLWLRWLPGLHLSALALSVWIIKLGDRLPHGPHYWLLAVIGFGVAAAAMAASRRGPDAGEGRVGVLAPTAATYGLSLGLIGLMAMQFARNAPLGTLVILAAVTLLIVVGMIAWAMRTYNRPALWIAYAAFTAEILALYVKVLGSLLGTSLFFGLAGILVIALAWAAVRLTKLAPEPTDGDRP